MDIVDAQGHLGPGGIPEMLASMDALGIAAVLIDEFWFVGGPDEMPTYSVQTPAGTLRRSVSPTAQLAALMHPARFSYVAKIDRGDPELQSLARLARDTPAVRALRITPGLTNAELAALRTGEYDEMFQAAGNCGLPVFVTVPGNALVMEPVAARFPAVTFIVDHCGMPFTAAMRQGLIAAGLGDDLPVMGTGDRDADFAAVRQLSGLPNVALKWGHPQGLFGVSGYPFVGLRSYLRSAIDAFGAGRIMWAGDATVNLTGESWAELLFWLIDSPDLTANERADILGGTLRRLLNWPA